MNTLNNLRLSEIADIILNHEKRFRLVDLNMKNSALLLHKR